MAELREQVNCFWKRRHKELRAKCDAEPFPEQEALMEETRNSAPKRDRSGAQIDLRHVPIKEEQRAQRLVLR